MSRIGSLPINIPSGVTVLLAGQKVTVTGPKGELNMTLRPEVTLEQLDAKLIIKRINDQKLARSLHGLTRSLVSNMVKGVSEGWSKDLEMVGVGYRAVGGGDSLTVQVGYSHPVVVKAPPGIQFSVNENTKIKVSGFDKELVGQVAANLRAIKPPEVYKGKGIRYQGERVRKKAGKTAGVTK